MNGTKIIELVRWLNDDIKKQKAVHTFFNKTSMHTLFCFVYFYD